MVRFIKTKDAADATIQEMILATENARQNAIRVLHITWYDIRNVKRLLTDNVKEFLSTNFTKWLVENGIHHELTSAYSPESNEKAERLHRTLLDMARTMLISGKHLPQHNLMWAEAINTECYIRNRLSTSASSEKKTPYELILNKRPDVSHIRAFGAKSYVHKP